MHNSTSQKENPEGQSYAFKMGASGNIQLENEPITSHIQKGCSTSSQPYTAVSFTSYNT